MADQSPFTPASPPQRLARYRSQRKPQSHASDQVPELPQVPPQDSASGDDHIARSKSRYRRAGANGSQPATARSHEQSPTSPRSPRRVPAMPSCLPKLETSESEGHEPDYRASPLQSSQQPVMPRPNMQRVESESTMRSFNGRMSSREPISAQSPASPPTHPTVNELFPPPRLETKKAASPPRRRDGPPTSEQIEATKSTKNFSDGEETDEESGGCFGLFKKKRDGTAPPRERLPIARRATGEGPATIKPGGGGVVPGTDAPVSAVNAGDRGVLVECGQSKILVPVTPSTTPVDVIHRAASCMTELINVKSAVLLESFGTVGVQRPLRRYEHIRDVMNSWDTDRQNSLVLIDPGTGSSENELSISGAPSERPGGGEWLLLFSQRPGKWEKRVVSLHADGQVTMQKDDKKTKRAENICHLSDFDVYTPTAEKTRKKIKPPKKFCYAIKSQQKTSMFEESQTFVHFFCTADRGTADSFHAAIQRWRSWYLVNVMGEGAQSNTPALAGEKNGLAESHHRPGESTDSHYQLGSFKPLLETDQLQRRPDTSRSRRGATHAPSADRLEAPKSRERSASDARQGRRPSDLNEKSQLADDEPLGNLGRRTSTHKRRPSLDQNEEFAATALLGRSYSQRQREVADGDAHQQQPCAKTGLLGSQSSGTPQRSRSTRAQPAHEASDASNELRRNASTRTSSKPNSSHNLIRNSSTARSPNRPKPLVDLTPTYREPPQHARKGKGYNPDGSVGGPLVESATSPEDPLGIPPSTDWRGRNAVTNDHSHNAPSPDSRSLSMTRKHNSVRRPATATTRVNEPFTGEGLLAAQNGGGWTGKESATGRGVMDGSHAKGPMVDLSSDNMFAPGSLLDKSHGDGRQQS